MICLSNLLILIIPDEGYYRYAHLQINENVSLEEGDSLVVFYYLSASEIWEVACGERGVIDKKLNVCRIYTFVLSLHQ